jgi:hypothetical protein
MIETIGALVLAAVMMTTVMTVVTALARHGPSEGQDHGRWRQRVTDLIAQDILHARGIQSRDNRVTLNGHPALDQQTLEPSHRPVTVTYHIHASGGQSWLVRTQTDTDSRSMNNHWSEVVASGVTGIEVTEAADITPAPGITRDGSEPTVTQRTQVEHAPYILTLTWSAPDPATTSYRLIAH